MTSVQGEVVRVTHLECFFAIFTPRKNGEKIKIYANVNAHVGVTSPTYVVYVLP